MDWTTISGVGILLLGIFLLGRIGWRRFISLDRSHLRYSPGIEVSFLKSAPKVWLVSGVHPSSSAFRSGIRPGDELLEISGNGVYGTTRRELARLLRPRRASTVRLTVKAADGSIQDHQCDFEDLEWPLAAKDRLQSSTLSPSLLVSDSTRMTNGMTVSRTSNVKYPSHGLTEETIDSSLR